MTSPLTLQGRHTFVLMLFLFFFAFIVALFVPKDAITLRSLKLWGFTGNANQIVIYGNSVIDAASNCDKNKASIAKLLETYTERNVLDLSSGGQQLDFTLGNVGLLITSGHSKDIVVPVSLFQLMSSNTYPVWTSLLFQIPSGGLEISSLNSRIHANTYISGSVPKSQQPFSYKSKNYPDYAQLSAIYYSKEKNNLVCPSRLGVDLDFIEANYFKSYLLAPIQDLYFNDLKSIQLKAAQVGIRVTYVLLPIDFEDISSLDPTLGTSIADRLNKVRTMLNIKKVDYLDLSESLPATAFADRFCACGHLNQEGRVAVATQIKHVLVGEK